MKTRPEYEALIAKLDPIVKHLHDTHQSQLLEDSLDLRYALRQLRDAAPTDTLAETKLQAPAR